MNSWPRKGLNPNDTMGALYGKRLRQRRLDHGWTQRFLGAKVHVVHSRINQLERATGAKPTVELSARLDEVLSTDGLLTDLTPHVRREAYPDFVRAHLDQEAVATSIRVHMTGIVHGLLQTEEYAHALLSVGRTLRNEEHLEERLAARMERQPRLDDPGLEEFVMVVGEAALHCPVGGKQVWRGQLARLLEAAEHPRITVQVLPFASGEHPSMQCSLMLLELPDGSESAYEEAGDFGRLHEEPADLRLYVRRYDRIRALALPPRPSLDLIRSVMEGRHGAAGIATRAQRRKVAAEQLQQRGGRLVRRGRRGRPRRGPRPGQ